jgi:hypothetical protein
MANNWFFHPRWKRCSVDNECPKCREDNQAKPHGPYYRLKRHPPGGRWDERDMIYVGSTRMHPWLEDRVIRQQLLDYLNVHWSGTQKPTRGMVLRAGKRLSMGMVIL